MGVFVVGRDSNGFLGRFCFGFIGYQPKRKHDDPSESGFHCIWPLLRHYWVTVGRYWQLLAAIVPPFDLLAAIGRYCAVIVPLLAAIGHHSFRLEVSAVNPRQRY